MSEREKECAVEWRDALLAGDYNTAAYYRDAGLAAKEDRLFAVVTPPPTPATSRGRARRAV